MLDSKNTVLLYLLYSFKYHVSCLFLFTQYRIYSTNIKSKTLAYVRNKYVWLLHACICWFSTSYKVLFLYFVLCIVLCNVFVCNTINICIYQVICWKSTTPETNQLSHQMYHFWIRKGFKLKANWNNPRYLFVLRRNLMFQIFFLQFHDTNVILYCDFRFVFSKDFFIRHFWTHFFAYLFILSKLFIRWYTLGCANFYLKLYI